MEPEKAHKPRKPRRRKAVIDRIEEGKWAVLHVGYKRVEKVIPVEELPEGAREGSWLKVRLVDDAVKDIIVDEKETAAVRGRVQSKLEMLRGRKGHFKPISAAETQGGSNRLQNPPSDKTESDEKRTE
jgi:hypothetical protein